MQERHQNRRKYFDEQSRTTANYVIPFVNGLIHVKSGMNVLEIGCGEGGNIIPFLEKGCKVVGVDMSILKIELGKEWLGEYEKNGSCSLILKDIYEVDDLGTLFDLIIMRDVIEHIHDQEKFMRYIKKFLAPGGYVFFGFPPWQNPFGGHQQICESKLLSKLPYFHLLPKSAYKMILQLFGESEAKIGSLLEIKETAISIERFEKILRKTSYKIDKRQFFLFNPNYEIKFNIKPRNQSALVSSLPFIRNFFTTACYYMVSLKNSQ